MSTGMPAGIWLNKFGVIVRDYFGHVPYHVGSSLHTKDWRDIDVRLILPDDEYEALFGSVHATYVNPRFAAITLAFAALAREMTGLPVDFQIQRRTWANEHYGGQPRSALIEVPRGEPPEREETPTTREQALLARIASPAAAASSTRERAAAEEER